MSKTLDQVQRYQITTFNAPAVQFSRVANQSVISGLTWDDVAKRLDASIDGNQMNADMITVAGENYCYTDEAGRLNVLKRYLLPE